MVDLEMLKNISLVNGISGFEKTSNTCYEILY